MLPSVPEMVTRREWSSKRSVGFTALASVRMVTDSSVSMFEWLYVCVRVSVILLKAISRKAVI